MAGEPFRGWRYVISVVACLAFLVCQSCHGRRLSPLEDGEGGESVSHAHTPSRAEAKALFHA